MICKIDCSVDQIVKTDKSTCKDSFPIINMWFQLKKKKKKHTFKEHIQIWSILRTLLYVCHVLTDWTVTVLLISWHETLRITLRNNEFPDDSQCKMSSTFSLLFANIFLWKVLQMTKHINIRLHRQHIYMISLKKKKIKKEKQSNKKKKIIIIDITLVVTSSINVDIRP